MTALAVEQRYQSKLFPGSSHSWALQQVAGLPSSTRVLDIGPGNGVIGRALRDRSIEQVCAVEIDSAARQHLKPIYSRIEASLDPYEREAAQFDLVLMLDVLEHMADPFEFLARVRRLMPIGARALISVPNIAHWSMRLGLLFGFFEYTNRGLLDRTHLQFFNRRRFEKLLASEGFSPQLRSASIEPIELILPASLTQNSFFRLASQLRTAVARTLPGVMAYQLLGVTQAT